ncbi:MAG: iron-containing alcohol dehydrogenase [Oscillospiraceae bacterium]|nr:iron-containing alcohol dehydrogenase [Oscillospiraceae bacterium]
MYDFVYQNTTKILFGRGISSQIGPECAEYGHKALIVYGGQSAIKSGLISRIKQSLSDCHIEYFELGGVKANPLLSKVQEGIELCRREKIRFLLAVGGGSVIDTAKAVSAGTDYSGDVWDLFTGTGRFHSVLPVGAVVTIPGTGSESSNGAVITNESSGYKMDIIDDRIRPRFAVLDPELTFTLPAFQTFCAITDILSHVMERYFTGVPYADVSDELCEGLMRAVIKNARILLSDPTNYNARAEVMWAAVLAHNNLLSSGRGGDWASHAIGTELSALYDCTHGATLSVITPAWMHYVMDADLPIFTQYAMRVWQVQYDRNDPRATALEGIRRLKAFFEEIGVPTTLNALGVPSDHLEQIAERAVRNGPIGGIKSLQASDVLKILGGAK